MVVKQKRIINPIRLFVGTLVLIFSILAVNVSTSQPVNAACGPGEVQGNPNTPPAIDPNLCYRDGTPTANTPDAAPPPEGEDPAGGEDTETTCAVQKVGWIICPVIEFSATIGDQAFNMLANLFLETEPELVADDSGTRIAWELARNIANILFIIAFLVIIFSQVTGRGLDNYGIKKTLPRLIIAAIAVNASYFICQAMVDISNILGWEIKNFLVQTASQVTDSVAMPPQTSVNNQTGDGALGVLGTIAIAVLALGSIALFIMPALGSTILIILITCVTIIVILLLRKAIIVLLVVLSPIAFVAYLLPNTEKLFNKWLSMFWKLLMVFPVVALLFGGGQLASAVILVAGSNGTQTSQYSDDSGKCIQLPTTSDPSSEPEVKDCGAQDGQGLAQQSANSTPLLLGLTAAGIAVAPMLAVMTVLKGALAAAGAVGGAIQNLSKPMLDRQRKRRGEDMDAADKRRQLAAMNNKWSPSNVASLGGRRRRGFRDQARRSTEQELNYVTQKAAAEKAQEDAGYARQMAGGSRMRPFGGVEDDAIDRALRRAEFTLDKADIEEVNAMNATIDKLGLTSDQIQSLSQGGEVEMADGTKIGGKNARKAAIQRLAQQQDIEGLEKAIGSAGTDKEMGGYLAKTIEQNWGAIKSKGAHITTGGLLDDLRQGNGGNLDSAMQEAMGGMDANLLSTQKGTTLDRMQRNMAAGGRAAQTAKEAANALQSAANSQIYANVDANRRGKISGIGR